MVMTDGNDGELDYAYFMQQALRGVVRDVLKITQDLGAPPGAHHFYVEFSTTAPGVQISDHLRAQYPDRMTIVLQHQFEDLAVNADHFAVTLHFKGVPDSLVIPFDAVTQFADPSVNYALQFVPAETPVEGDSPPEAQADGELDAAEDTAPDAPAPDGDGPKGSAEVVSLDRFRKK